MAEDKSLPLVWKGENPLTVASGQQGNSPSPSQTVSPPVRQQPPPPQQQQQPKKVVGTYLPASIPLPVFSQVQHAGLGTAKIATPQQLSAVTGGATHGIRTRAYALQLTPTVVQVVESVEEVTSVETTVPDKAVKFLIGKQGAAISTIQKQSKAHFDFAKVGWKVTINRLVHWIDTQGHKSDDKSLDSICVLCH